MRSLLLAVSAFALASPAVAAEASGPWQAKGRELLENAINIPSVTTRPEEVKKLVAYLKGEFEKGGFSDIVVKDYAGTQGLIVRWKAAGKTKAKPMLLLGHMDVVDAKREDWPRDPFKMVEADGYFYGRGTTDMKNGVVAITHALLRLKAEGFQPKRDIIVFFSGDEETDGEGARLASTQWRKLVDADFALNADDGGGAFTKDGTSLGFAIQTSEKMFQSYTFTARNPGGHSSRPRPDNAIYDLAGALKRLERMRQRGPISSFASAMSLGPWAMRCAAGLPMNRMGRLLMLSRPIRWKSR